MALALLVLDCAHFDLLAFVQCSSQLGSPLLVLDFSSGGSCLPLRSLARCGLMMLVSGLTRPGFVFLLSAVDDVCLGLLVPLQHHTRSDFAAPILDLLHLDSVLFLRSLTQVDPPHSMFGALRTGSALSLFGEAHLESSSFLKSLSCIAFVLFILDSTNTDFSILSKACGRLDFALFVAGLSCTGSVFGLFVVDACLSDFLLLMRYLAHLDSPILVLKADHLDFPTSSHSSGCLDFMTFVLGLTCVGSVSFLFLIDVTTTESTLSTRGFSRLGLLLFISDMEKLGSILLLQSPACLDFGVSVCGLSCVGSVFALFLVDGICMGSATLARSFQRVSPASFALEFGHIGFFLFLREPSRLGFVFLPCGSGCLESTTSLFDAAFAGLTLFVKSSACSDLLLPAFDLAGLGSLLFSRDFGYSGFGFSVFGLTRSEPLFALLLVDTCQIDPTTSLQSFACLELAAPLLGSSTLGLLLSLRSFSCLGSPLLILSFVKVGSFTSPKSCGCIGLPVSIPGLACVDVLVLPSILDFLHLDFSMLTRSLARSEFAVFPLETSWVGSLMFTRSLAHSGLSVFVLDMTNLGLIISLHSFAHVDSIVFVSGAVCFDLVFSLSVVDASYLGSSVFLHYFARSDPVLFAFDHLRSGSPPLARSFACLESVILVSDFAQSDLFTSMQSHLQTGPSPFAAGCSRTGFVFLLLLIDSTTLGSSLLPQCLAYLGPVLLILGAEQLGLAVSPHSLACLEASMFSFGMSCLALFVSPLDAAQSDPPLLPRCTA